MKAVVYHEDYNKYDLGVSHPLIGDKPRKTIEFFKEKKILDEVKLIAPKKATEKDLLRVHDAVYVDFVKTLSETGGWLASDTPAPVGIFEYACLATGGTLLGGRKLFEGFDCMVNPLAGFHHASRDSSSGFCFFNDIAVAIEYLREIYMLKRFLIIDLDVHHCNGTQDIYYADPTVLTVSFHQDGRTLYPGTGSMDETGQGEGIGYTVNLPFPPGTGDRSYLYAFDEIIPCLTHEFNPEVIIYQSGVDTHHSDPLAGLNLTFQTYHHLAKKIIELSRSTCNRLLVLFGGGYNSDSSVKSYFNIMCGFLDRDDYLEEKSTDESNQKYVERIVRDLKIKIGEYWSLK